MSAVAGRVGLDPPRCRRRTYFAKPCNINQKTQNLTIILSFVSCSIFTYNVVENHRISLDSSHTYFARLSLVTYINYIDLSLISEILSIVRSFAFAYILNTHRVLWRTASVSVGSGRPRPASHIFRPAFWPKLVYIDLLLLRFIVCFHLWPGKMYFVM